MLIFSFIQTVDTTIRAGALGFTVRPQKAPVMLIQLGATQSENFFLMLLQTTVALALVCSLAYVLFRWVVPILVPGMLAGRSSRRLVRMVEVTTLDARRSLYVVEVTGRWLVIGSSESGLQLISELNAEAAEQAIAAATTAMSQPTPLNQIATAWRKSVVDHMTSLVKKGR